MGLHDLPVNRFRDIERSANFAQSAFARKVRARIADDMRASALAPTTWSRESTTVRTHCPRNTRTERNVLVDIFASRA
jgi:hypothetical protein